MNSSVINDSVFLGSPGGVSVKQCLFVPINFHVQPDHMISGWS